VPGQFVRQKREKLDVFFFLSETHLGKVKAENMK
jgi:hypothetical protein